MTLPDPTPEAVIAVIRQLAREGQINRGVARLPLDSGTTMDQLALESLDLIILADSLATHFGIDLDERIAFEPLLTIEELTKRIAEGAKTGKPATSRRTDATPPSQTPSTQATISPHDDTAFAPLLAAFDALMARLQSAGQTAEIPPEWADQVVDEFHRVSRLMSAGLFATETPDSSRHALGAHFQRGLLPIIALAGTAYRFYSKPLGYAGDFYTIELIYQNVPKGEGRLGALIDRCFLEAPTSRAVRNRRGLLTGEILRHLPPPGQSLRAMSLGCGPLREVFDAFHRLDDLSRLEMVAVDIDPRALEFSRQRAEVEGLGNRVRWVHADLMSVAHGDHSIDLPPQNLIYSTHGSLILKATSSDRVANP
ncbi:extracellular factor (EF) 3-hydroxypalmitic acid methyl ester biosynthesis protein [Gammaproteobacteria bacterium]